MGHSNAGLSLKKPLMAETRPSRVRTASQLHRFFADRAISGPAARHSGARLPETWRTGIGGKSVSRTAPLPGFEGDIFHCVQLVPLSLRYNTTLPTR